MASPILDDFLCPITLEIMNDPVICEDGYTYERTSIMSIHNSLSPMTRQPINKSKLIPNRALKSAIDRFLSSNPQFQDILLERRNKRDIELKTCLDLEPKQKSYKLCKIKKRKRQSWNNYIQILFLLVLVWMVVYLINLIYLNCTKSMISVILIIFIVIYLY